MKHLLAGLVLLLAFTQAQTIVTIASVNNPDMVTMQELSAAFEAENPDIALEWLFLDEGTLRSRLTTDISTNGGSFDLFTIGAYETPQWGALGWIESIDKLNAANPDVAPDYDFADLLPAIKDGLSVNGELFAVPLAVAYTGSLYLLPSREGSCMVITSPFCRVFP